MIPGGTFSPDKGLSLKAYAIHRCVVRPENPLLLSTRQGVGGQHHLHHHLNQSSIQELY